MQPIGLGDPKVHRITGRVYAITNLYHTAEGFSTNAGIIFTSETVIFIDAGMTIASGEFLWKTAVERMSNQKKFYLILSHHHSDHVFGMQALKEKGAKVIAHEEVRGSSRTIREVTSSFLWRRFLGTNKRRMKCLAMLCYHY